MLFFTSCKNPQQNNILHEKVTDTRNCAHISVRMYGYESFHFIENHYGYVQRIYYIIV